MRTSLIKRLKITGTGKIMRRPQGLGHSRINKNRKQVMRKKSDRSVSLPTKTIRKKILTLTV